MTTDESRNMKDISASEYIRTNFDPSDRIAVLVRNGGTGETIQRIATAERIAGTSAQEWLQHKNEKEACEITMARRPWRRFANPTWCRRRITP